MIFRLVAAVLLWVALVPPIHGAFDRWTPWGPMEGPLQALLVDPDQAGILHALSDSGTVYQSRDDGRSWSWAGRGLASSRVDGLARGSGHRLWALARTDGVWRSDDRAASWQRVSLEPYCGDGSASSQDRFVGFAVASGAGKPDALFAVCGDQLWHSADAGHSWSRRALPAVPNRLVLDPADPRRVAITDTSAPWVSSDGRATWHRSPVTPAPARRRVSLVGVVPSEPTALFAAVRIDNPFSARLFRSLDWGITWVQVALTSPWAPVTDLAYDPGNPHRLALVGAILYCSETLGHTVEPCSPTQLRLQTARTAAFAPAGGRLYATWHGVQPHIDDTEVGPFANDAGTLLSFRDIGRPWSAPELIASLGAPQRVEFAGSVGGSRRVYALSSRNLFVSEDEGASWFGRPPQADPDPRIFSHCWTAVRPLDLAIDPARMSRLWSATDCGVYESLDEGRTWARRRFSAFNHGSIVRVSAETLLESRCDVLRSTDGGRTWRIVLACPASSTGAHFGATSLLQDPRRPQVVYASTHFGNTIPYQPDRRVMRSLDGGLTWRPFVAGGDLLAIDSRRSTTLYTVVRGVVLRSTNDGRRWEVRGALVADPFDEIPVALVTDPERPDNLYARVRSGAVLRSLDGGISWTHSEEGLPRLPPVGSALTLAADPPGGQGRIFQATSLGLYWVKFTD